MNNITLKDIEEKVFNDISITEEEMLQIVETTQKEELYNLAIKITKNKSSLQFDTCSIINAKSGKCSENCKWCSQSIYSKSKIDVYQLLSKEECCNLALFNEAQGINRFSLVTSGKKLTQSELKKTCEIVKYIKSKSKINICASLGLLSEDDLRQLKEAGVSRYHCNLETAPSYFPSLCTTHTTEQKINTLKNAVKVGLELCSGGIIGMGETMKQRIEFAAKLRELKVQSIPVNILNPIKGTPLENQQPLSEDEILTTISVFRIMMPNVFLRFAGGRILLSKSTMKKAMQIGINSAIVGDMLTTIGCDISEDKALIKSVGYTL